jgi:HK97 family phage prohead protease
MPPAFQIVTKHAELSAPQSASDELEFIASDESVDRYGDIIRVDGWQLDAYQRNPVVLFGHDSHAPVGVAPRVWKDGAKLRAAIKLAAPGTSELIDGLRALVAQRIIRAVSVGFRPTVEPNVLRDDDDEYTGLEFIGQELLELSLVAVPANPHALAVAKELNLSAAVMQRTFAAVHGDGVQRVALARAGLDMHRTRAASDHAVNGLRK